MDAKGRNGEFKVDQINVWIDKFSEEPIKTVVVDIRAKKSGWNPPAFIRGTKQEMIEFCRIVLAKCFDDELSPEVFIASITLNALEGKKEEKS